MLLWRIQYRFYRLSRSLRTRLRRRVTNMGLVFIGALLLTSFMGIDTDNNMDYQVFSLLLFLCVVASGFNWFFRLPFAPRRILPRFGTVGCPLTYKLLIKNLGPRNYRGLTALEELADPGPSFEQWFAAQRFLEKHSFRFAQSPLAKHSPPAQVKSAALGSLPVRQEVAVELELIPLRRGVLRFSGANLARTDPFGLFRAFCHGPFPQSLLVLPKRYPLPPLALSGCSRYQSGGVALASSVGQSEEFVALRDYRHGDPLRHIHWRTWARLGKPVVKEYEDEFFVRHALVLDTFTQRDPDEALEEAVSVAASFACTLQTQESLLDLMFVGARSYCFTSGRGVAHEEQMLEILASVSACRSQSFGALEHLVLDHVRAVSGCVCVLLDWDEPRRSLVRKLRECGLPVLVLVITGGGGSQALGESTPVDQQTPVHVLEAGRIEQDLARL
jgi:uncharacterized protein (DUF58 family)